MTEALLAMLSAAFLAGVGVGVWFGTAKARRAFVERMTYPKDDEDEHVPRS